MNSTNVKICGLTNLADARVAVNAGADLLGFIFYPNSPRYVEPAAVAAIVEALGHSPTPAGALPKFVGVFVNESLVDVQRTMAQVGLDYAQLHGDETPETVTALAGRGYKALRPQHREEALAGAARFAVLGPADGPQLLVDAYDPHLYGGTGRRADWSAAAQVAAHCRLLLAGSLTPQNVAQAIQAVQPWGVDVSSGVEAQPGRKDHGAIQAFMAAAKGAG